MKRIFFFCALSFSLLYSSCSLLNDDDEKAATYLKISPTEITFEAGNECSFTVDTDGEWIAITTDKVTLSTTKGSAGVTSVSILAFNSTSPQFVVVRTPSNTSLSEMVKIIPGEGGGSNGDTPSTPSKTLYYEDFDGDPSYSNWANNSTVWQNPTGEGVGNITYESSYAKIKNDSYGSANRYSGASGKCYMNIYKPTGNPTYVEIHNIATTHLGCPALHISYIQSTHIAKHSSLILDFSHNSLLPKLLL